MIGSQWFTWSPEEAGNEHFRWALAPARTFYPSVEVGGWADRWVGGWVSGWVGTGLRTHLLLFGRGGWVGG